MTPRRHPVVRPLKAVCNLAAIVLVFPAALTCWMEQRFHAGAEGVFTFWTHILALLPGLPGMYIRRAFYHLTLHECSLDCSIGFGALFSHRQAHVEDGVNIGPYSVVGCARLRTGSLVGTRANLLSGSGQHELREDGQWESADPTRFREIQIGPHAWIGEAAVVMADVGAASLVAAGSVVSAAVPPAVLVAGNPARFVRKTLPVPVPASPVPAAEKPIPYVSFIDWLKCLGILLILFGHIAGWTPAANLPPIYLKQIGVALFFFVTGYSLTQDTREPWRVAFNRLFELYLFGLTLALVLSALAYASTGQLQLSNYAPLVVGANVVFNFFPANPTTWYLGTYIHVILVWVLVVRRIRLSIPLLALSLVVEIAVRMLLMKTAGHFVAYMSLANWATVFLAGCWCSQRRSDGARGVSDHMAVGAGIMLVIAVIGWARLGSSLPFVPGFPFSQLGAYGPVLGTILTSALVSTLYLGATSLTYLAAAPLPILKSVRFVARNTLVIFLGHMPIFFALRPRLEASGLSRGASSAILMAICIVGLALLSEGLHRALRTRKLRDRLYPRVIGWVLPSARTAQSS